MFKTSILYTLIPEKKNRRNISIERQQEESMDRKLNYDIERMERIGFDFYGVDIIGENKKGQIKFVAFYHKA